MLAATSDRNALRLTMRCPPVREWTRAVNEHGLLLSVNEHGAISRRHLAPGPVGHCRCPLGSRVGPTSREKLGKLKDLGGLHHGAATEPRQAPGRTSRSSP